MIVDSGERREFNSGAVRDICEGKGRCDLLPLDVIGKLFGGDRILYEIHNFMYSRSKMYLENAVKLFCDKVGWNESDMTLELAKHFEEGAKKYSERNWEKGIPLHCYIDSGVRHYLKYCRGDNDERHDRAFVWNMVCCIWTFEYLPEMNDLPKRDEDEDDGYR